MIYQLTSPWAISGSVTIPGGVTLNPGLPPNSNMNYFGYNGVFLLPSIVTANWQNQTYTEFNIWNALAINKIPPVGSICLDQEAYTSMAGFYGSEQTILIGPGVVRTAVPPPSRVAVAGQPMRPGMVP